MSDEQQQLQQIREEQARRFAERQQSESAQPAAHLQQQQQQTTQRVQEEPTNVAETDGGAPQQQQPGPTQPTVRRDLIGLPGQDAFLTKAEIEQRQRAAEKNRELDAHNDSYDSPQPATRHDRPPAEGDQPRRIRMMDDWANAGEEPMPDLSDMLAEARAEMQAMGIDLDADFANMSDDIEREIDERLAADGAVPDAAGNVLQIFDAQGNDMVDPAGPNAEAMDPQNTGNRGARNVDPRVFDNYSVVSTLSHSKALSDENKHCAICQEELKDGDTVRRLKCLHVFHQDCVDQWLHREPKCPVCKMQFEEGIPAPEGPKGPA